MGFTVALYILSLSFLVFSWFKDKNKTMMGLKKAKISFLNVLPNIATILGIVGLLMTFVSPGLVAKFMGEGTGLLGMLLASLLGAVALMPPFVAFPLAGSVLEMGGGIVQVATFISTFTLVGVLTMPLEIKYFGKKITIIRNGISYLYSFSIALLLGVMLS